MEDFFTRFKPETYIIIGGILGGSFGLLVGCSIVLMVR